jgi:phosphopantothenoylcysteine decarboxylase / phosphopantothenate---cysteine ligase
MNIEPSSAPPDLAGRTILVGVCGGIAAYKCAGVVSKLRQAGADVHVIMTDAACKFVTPLTFQALSGNDVHTEMFDAGTAWQVAHITLVRKSELFLVLNATANTLAKIAHGVADNLLTTCVLATRNPVLVAPAMNTAMLDSAATRENIAALTARGLEFVEPGSGFLACGEIGDGRLADEDDIVAAVVRALERGGSMAGERVVVTAGPTREFADPARFLSNASSGRMGYALAGEAQRRGAHVTLISGPAELAPPFDVDIVRVVTAREMHAAALAHLPDTTMFIGAAAVADFRPSAPASSKVKKDGATMQMELERNPDIIADISARRPKGCLVVGFAAETDDLRANGLDKLARKKLDCIVVNRIGENGSGAFAGADNEVLILWAGGEQAVPRASKPSVAASILDRTTRLRSGA